MKTPGRWTVRKLFAGRPKSLKLFQVVRRYVESLGPVKVEAAKTQVSFGARTKFAWIWLPQMWIKRRPEDSVTLAFDLGRHAKDRRIAESVEARPGRWVHHVVIERASDFDPKVRGWLRESYAFGQVNRRLRKKTTR